MVGLVLEYLIPEIMFYEQFGNHSVIIKNVRGTDTSRVTNLASMLYCFRKFYKK